MSTNNTHSHDKSKKISLSICFLELSEKLPRETKNEIESAMVNTHLVFESLNCISFTLYLDLLQSFMHLFVILYHFL